jgi:RNA polymerase sigma-70 factor (ECF subfamily)
MTEPADDFRERLCAARAGSAEALGKLLEDHRAYLLSIAQRELAPHLQAKAGASDLVQQTVLEALRDFARFQTGSREEFLAWLRRLLLNNVGDFTRQYQETDKRQINREVRLAGPASGGTCPEPAGTGPTPSTAAMSEEQAQAIERALERLPEEYRRVIVLRSQEDRSFEEIGQLLERSPNAARKLWLRAIERLQEELGERP